MANLVEIPSCDICVVEFDDNVIPRILTGCGHTICEKCIRKMMKNGEIQCPYDKKFTVCRDPSKLPKNFALATMADEFRRAELKHAPPHPKRYFPLCHENPAHFATVFCEDCRADLCNECFNAVHAFNLMKHHMKNTLDDRLDQDTNCPVHRHLEVKYVCMSKICVARYRLGCRWCFASGEHKEHCHMKLTGNPNQEHIYFLTPPTPPPRCRHPRVETTSNEVPPTPPPRFVPDEMVAPRAHSRPRHFIRNMTAFLRSI